MPMRAVLPIVIIDSAIEGISNVEQATQNCLPKGSGTESRSRMMLRRTFTDGCKPWLSRGKGIMYDGKHKRGVPMLVAAVFQA